MRLCFIANPNIIHTERWLRYFFERGNEVHLLPYSPPSRPLPPGVILHDLTARTNVRKLRFAAWGLLARRVVHRLKPDVLHALQVASAGWLGAAAGYHPFIVSAWGSDLLLGPRRSWAQHLLARWVLRRADHISCVSADLALAAQALGGDPGRIQVEPLGIDTALFSPATGADAVQLLRAQFGLGPGPVVLSLRAMQPIYNPLDIAAAIPCVLKQTPTAQFVIRTYNASAELLVRFQAIVAATGAGGAVHYIGEQSDDRAIAALNQVADVALSVPSSDGTPTSVLEAMSCGAVPVVTDLPSLHEWVQEGREALFVPVGDVAAIVAAVVRLLHDEPLRREMQANGLDLTRRRADSRVWMAHAHETYERLCR
ncbi:MAG: glycosyltransferase [Anaerolineae bacterium]|nr:glycosyltransferase [Anaerolineae bacterium]